MNESSFYYGVSGTLAVVLVFFAVVNPHPLAGVNLRLTDAMMAHRFAARQPSIVTVVAIDKNSLGQVGRWPWDRTKLATLIDRIHDCHPSAIGLDLDFFKRQHARQRRYLENLQRKLAAVRGTGPARSYLQQMLTTLSVPDQALAASIARAGTVVIGYIFVKSNDTLPRGLAVTTTVSALSLISSSTLPVIAIGRPLRRHAYFPVVNIPVISSASLYKGFLNLFPDSDGVIRHYPLVLQAGGKTFPSLALMLASLSSGLQAVATEDSSGIESLKLLRSSGNAIKVPVDTGGRMRINYPPRQGTPPEIPAADVLNKTFDPALLQHKVVIVGITAPGLFEPEETPVSDAVPGVYLQALAANQLITGRFLLDFSQNPLLNALLVLVLMLLLIMSPAPQTPVQLLLKSLALLVSYTLIVLLVFSLNSLLLNIVYPLITLLAGGIVLSACTYACGSPGSARRSAGLS